MRSRTFRLHVLMVFALSCLSAIAFGQSFEPSNLKIDRAGFIFEKPPTPGCHASTIEQTSDGTIVAAWFAGTDEGEDDVEIYVARYEMDSWSTPVPVASGLQYHGPDGNAKRYPCWNPVLFQSPNGPLLLFYKVGPSPRSWWGMMTRSFDQGKTWEPGQRLPEGIYGPIKNKPLAIDDSTILCPTSTEDQGWRVHFEWTTDLGQTWTRTEPIPMVGTMGVIQPTLLRMGPHRFRALGRSQQGKVFTTDSTDNGVTWTPIQLTELSNPNSGVDAVTLHDGRHLLVYNDTPRGRSPLNVAISDDGETWTPIHILESEKGEFSYPAVIQAADQKVHITYTWNRTHIKHVILDVSLDSK